MPEAIDISRIILQPATVTFLEMHTKPSEILQPVAGTSFNLLPKPVSVSEYRKLYYGVGEKWYWLDHFYHYQHFTPVTLRRLFESAGFAVERLYTATGDYGVDNVRKACVRHSAKFADEKLFSSELARFESEGRGEEIRFFVRKPVAPVA